MLPTHLNSSAACTQLHPHTGFEDETEFLERLFSHLGSRSYVLGEAREDHLQWHVYEAGSAARAMKPTFNLEICMTELGAQESRQFFRTESFVSAEQTTKDTGIALLKVGCALCGCAVLCYGCDGNAVLVVKMG